MSYSVLLGDCRGHLRDLPDNSIDACGTDTPYDLTSIVARFGADDAAPAQFGTDGVFQRSSRGFMGKTWDATGIAFDRLFWKEALRVLKPGAHLAAFGGTRTYHRMAVAIEDAGFEVRDSIHWIYGSGFPKNHNIGRNMDGLYDDVYRAHGLIPTDGTETMQMLEYLGTALKPGHEPIILARKPISEASIAANVLKWGTGALNIDACRIQSGGQEHHRTAGSGRLGQHGIYGSANEDINSKQSERAANGENPRYDAAGRWPSNFILSHSADCNGHCAPDCPVAQLDAQSGVLTSGTGAIKRASSLGYQAAAYGKESRPAGTPNIEYGDTGGASRFFPTFRYDEELDFAPFLYVAKASRSEREEGLAAFVPKKVNDGRDTPIDNAYQRGETERKNTHPTVKPVALMRWLLRLITPPGGTVVDTFMGSGTTGVAAMLEDFVFIGMDGESEYVDISTARISHAAAKRQIERETPMQVAMF